MAFLSPSLFWLLKLLNENKKETNFHECFFVRINWRRVLHVYFNDKVHFADQMTKSPKG